MTDKVKKIREEVEKLMYGFNLEADVASCENAEAEKIADIKYQLCKKILEYIDTMQEEPVSEKKCMFTKDNYTDKDRKVLCEDCKEKCEYSKKEEPVSDGRDIFDNCLKSEEKFILPQKISGNINCENCLYSSACALGDIQACIIDKSVSEDLEEAIDEYAQTFQTVLLLKQQLMQ